MKAFSIILSVAGMILSTYALLLNLDFLRPRAIPPKGVVLFYPDGTLVPVQLRYGGWNRDRHEWFVIPPTNRADSPNSMTIESLPPKTLISFDVAIPMKSHDP
jgi:hypothetical protein